MADRSRRRRLSSKSSAMRWNSRAWARQFGALVALADINLRVARRRAAGDPRLERRRQDDAVQRRHRRLSCRRPGRIRFFGEDVTTFPVHERIRRGLRRTYQISQLFGGLTVHRQHLRRLPRRFARPLSPVCGRAPADAHDGAGANRSPTPSISTTLADRPVAMPEPWPAAAARNRAGAGRARRASSCSTSRRPDCRRPSGAISSPSSTRCRSISATSSSSTISMSRCASSTYVTMMHNGRIFKEGTPQEIEDDDEVQAIYLGAAHG